MPPELSGLRRIGEPHPPFQGSKDVVDGLRGARRGRLQSVDGSFPLICRMHAWSSRGVRCGRGLNVRFKGGTQLKAMVVRVLSQVAHGGCIELSSVEAPSHRLGARLPALQGA